MQDQMDVDFEEEVAIFCICTSVKCNCHRGYNFPFQFNAELVGWSEIIISLISPI